MKKFKHLSDIEAEKLRLRIKQLEQEKAIGALWKEVKLALNPGNFIRNKISEWSPIKESSDKLFSELTQQGVDWLIQKIGQRKKTD